ncbi:MAG: hypothetical protein KBT34_06935 [Prevotella sp.]|nr:hypothetical protein [Candidatus Prevotella equi]
MDSIIADIIIILSILALAATIGITLYSIFRSLKANKRPKMENGIPVRMIELCTVILLLAIALPSLLFGSLTDMCIITATVLLVIASTSIIYGRILSARLRKRV